MRSLCLARKFLTRLVTKRLKQSATFNLGTHPLTDLLMDKEGMCSRDAPFIASPPALPNHGEIIPIET